MALAPHPRSLQGPGRVLPHCPWPGLCCRCCDFALAGPQAGNVFCSPAPTEGSGACRGSTLPLRLLPPSPRHSAQAPPTPPFPQSAWGLVSRGSRWLVTHMFRGHLCQDFRAGCAHHLHDALQLVDICPAQEMPPGQVWTFSGPRTPDLGALPRACSTTADPEPKVAWQGAEEAGLARRSGAHLS